MPTNQIKQFAAGGGANALTPAAYAALTTLLSNGFQSGKADSIKFNTVLRQSSFIATMIAQFICDTAGVNVNDDGDLFTLKTNFIAAIDTLIGTETTRAENAEMSLSIALAAEISRAEGAEALLAPLASPNLTGNPTAPTQSPGNNSTRLATTAFVTAAFSALTVSPNSSISIDGSGFPYGWLSIPTSSGITIIVNFQRVVNGTWTFPKNYPNNHIGTFLTYTGSVPSSDNCGATSPTTTNVNIVTTGGGGFTAYAFSLGY